MPRKLLTKSGKLKCPKCGHLEAPTLIEKGYTVKHDLREIVNGQIVARGWDGSSDTVSESGDGLFLECRNCYADFPVPESLEVQWV